MTDREKIQKALAPLHASEDTVKEVLEMAERKEKRPARRSGRTILIAAAAAALLAGTALAVNGLGLSAGIRQYLHITEEEAQALAEQSPMVTSPDVSDTHDGVTVSVEQSVVDGGSAFIALRVEGLTVPEGWDPAWGEIGVTVGGRQPANMGFFAWYDMTWDGSRFVYEDGTPAAETAEGVPIPRYMRADGTLELDISLSPGQEEPSPLAGQEITVVIPRLGTAPVTLGPAAPEYTAEGPWVLTWTLEGTDQRRSWELREPLGDTGAAVTYVELSPLSVRLRYDYPMETYEEIGYDQNGDPVPVETLREPPHLFAVVMKDGAVYENILGGGTMGYGDDLEVYEVDMGLTRIIDPAEVAALIFQDVGCGDVPPAEQTWYTVELDN